MDEHDVSQKLSDIWICQPGEYKKLDRLTGRGMKCTLQADTVETETRI